MFAVIYRAYIKPGTEAQYQTLWHRVATYFTQERGALGSCLHKTDDGLWVAYSRWPNKAMRDASWPTAGEAAASLPEAVRQAIHGIKECIDQQRQLPEIEMEVVDDLLL